MSHTQWKTNVKQSKRLEEVCSGLSTLFNTTSASTCTYPQMLTHTVFRLAEYFCHPTKQHPLTKYHVRTVSWCSTIFAFYLDLGSNSKLQFKPRQSLHRCNNCRGNFHEVSQMQLEYKLHRPHKKHGPAQTSALGPRHCNAPATITSLEVECLGAVDFSHVLRTPAGVPLAPEVTLLGTSIESQKWTRTITEEEERGDDCEAEKQHSLFFSQEKTKHGETETEREEVRKSSGHKTCWWWVRSSQGVVPRHPGLAPKSTTIPPSLPGTNTEKQASKKQNKTHKVGAVVHPGSPLSSLPGLGSW